MNDWSDQMVERMFGVDLTLIAYHEAGHAVVRTEAGSSVDSITVNGYFAGIGWAGKSTVYGGGGSLHSLGPLAGYAATQVLMSTGGIAPHINTEIEHFTACFCGLMGDARQYLSLNPAANYTLSQVKDGGFGDYIEGVEEAADNSEELRKFCDIAIELAVPEIVKQWDRVRCVAEAVISYAKPNLEQDCSAELVISKSVFEQCLNSPPVKSTGPIVAS